MSWTLKTDRPLAVFDIESTGINPRMDRIIDLAIVIIMPDGERKNYTYRVNPECPIPHGASSVHGIYDADVKDSPPFRTIAPEVMRVLENCDLCGYNILHFDIPMLTEEFTRAGIPFSLEGRRLIDAQRIFHKREPRTLSAALKFYCGDDHVGAHGALEDVVATIDVLEGQFRKYPDLPREVNALAEECNPRDPSWLDSTGKIRWENGEAIINFGRNKGRTLRDLVATEAGFLRWVIDNNFPKDTRDILANALRGQFPEPPTAAKPAEETES
ncbi:MAG TPA: 3'-5' exonuclease [Kiritimatiellia bacterium]|nr:3'-5' exonuclease [Kiritimatiellia bacterium]